MTNQPISTTLPRSISFYLFLNNLLTSVFVIAVLKVFYELKIVHFRWIATLIFVSLLLKLLVYLKSFRRHLNLLKSQRIRQSKRDALLQSISYFYELPLSLFTFFCFTQVYYLPTRVDTLYLTVLVVASLYFSFIGILNCVLIENLNRLRSKQTNYFGLFFSFLFRYFFFVSRAISFILLLSTYNDDLSNESKFMRYQLPASFHLAWIYLLLSFLLLNLYWTFFISPKRQWTLGIGYESFKMLIDYNHSFFRPNKIKHIKFHETKSSLLKINLNKLIMIVHMSLRVLVQLSFAYFWYFKAILIYNHNQSKTTLLSLLSGLNTRLSLLNLYELEEKLKLRQLSLVTIIGCILISILCYFIYYAYYFSRHDLELANVEIVKSNYQRHSKLVGSRFDDFPAMPSDETTKTLQSINISQIDNEQILLPENLMIQASSLNSTEPASTFNLNGTSIISAYVDPIDGFSFDTYEQSSSVSSSPQKYANATKALNIDTKKKITTKKVHRIFTSDLDMMSSLSTDSETLYSSTSSSSSTSLPCTNSDVDTRDRHFYKKHFQHINSLRVNEYDEIGFNKRIFQDDESTSSGIMTTTEVTTSRFDSNSVMYEQTTTMSSASSSVVDNSTYIQQCDDSRSWRRASLNEMRLNAMRLNEYNERVRGSQSIQDKVLIWFNGQQRIQAQQQQEQQQRPMIRNFNYFSVGGRRSIETRRNLYI